MCGRFNVVDSPEVKDLCKKLGVRLTKSPAQLDIAPGSKINIIHGNSAARQISEAIWWLLLDTKNVKPNYRYASFNSRSAKLFIKNSISYEPFRESRCIIPGSAFIESLGDKKTYHKIELESSAIAFGGLYKEHLNPITGENIYSASIITLSPSSPEWQKIHPKSIPLMIDYSDDQIVDLWLDPDFKAVTQFQPLFAESGNRSMKVTPIGKPSRWNVVGDSFSILA